MKALILTNNLTASDKEIVSEGMMKVKQELTGIKFPFEYTIKNSNRQFTSVPFTAGADVGKGYHVHPAEILGEERVFGDYDIDCLIFDPAKVIPPAPTNPTDSAEVMQIPIDWFGARNGELTKEEKVRVFVMYFLHELSHEESWRHSVPDITHDFYTSAFAYRQPTEYYLFLLSRFMKPSKREATLKRTQVTPFQTLGIFSVGEKNWKSLELPWIQNLRNISSIPAGIYQVKWTFSFKFRKYTYEVMNVSGRSGIRIHSANYYFDLKGCIALGLSTYDLNKDGKLDVISSRVAIKQLEDYFNREPFTLKII